MLKAKLKIKPRPKTMIADEYIPRTKTMILDIKERMMVFEPEEGREMHEH
jgi:hypothetical protein